MSNRSAYRLVPSRARAARPGAIERTTRHTVSSLGRGSPCRVATLPRLPMDRRDRQRRSAEREPFDELDQLGGNRAALAAIGSIITSQSAQAAVATSGDPALGRAQ